MAKQARIKTTEVPAGWSVDAIDFTNKLLQRKPANRLGLLGTSEVKEHIWLKDFPWKDLYDKKLTAPYIPKQKDNFDPKYCNANEKISENTKIRYEIHLRDEITKQSFKNFEFFPGDVKSDFINPHLKLCNKGEDRVLMEIIPNSSTVINSANISNLPIANLMKKYKQVNGMNNEICYIKKKLNLKPSTDQVSKSTFLIEDSLINNRITTNITNINNNYTKNELSILLDNANNKSNNNSIINLFEESTVTNFNNMYNNKKYNNISKYNNKKYEDDEEDINQVKLDDG